MFILPLHTTHSIALVSVSIISSPLESTRLYFIRLNAFDQVYTVIYTLTLNFHLDSSIVDLHLYILTNFIQMIVNISSLVYLLDVSVNFFMSTSQACSERCLSCLSFPFRDASNSLLITGKEMFSMTTWQHVYRRQQCETRVTMGVANRKKHCSKRLLIKRIATHQSTYQVKWGNFDGSIENLCFFDLSIL